jgi:hypothetical protein
MRLQLQHQNMATSFSKPGKSSSRTACRRRDLLIVLLALLIILAACQPGGADKHSQVSPEITQSATDIAPPVIKATEGDPLSLTPTRNPTPQPISICVPARFLNAVAQSVETHLVRGELRPWVVMSCGDPAIEVAQGNADLALVPGRESVLVGSSRLALVVPFGSLQESLTLAQAQQVLDQGSASIQVLDWRDVSAQQRALRVDGMHPADTGYPLLQLWSLIAAPGFEGTAAGLAPVLSAIVSDDPVVMLSAVGDVMLDRKLGELIAAGWVDYPFEEVTGLLTGADLTIGNLESALGDLGEPANKDFAFQAPPEAAQALELAGFDLLSMANNHAMDFGDLALRQAIDLLRGRGIVTVGAGVDETAAHMPYITDVGGLTLAFLAFVNVPVEWMGFDTRSWAPTLTRPGVAWADPERIRSEVEAASYLADLVIVLLHSGDEFIYQPSSAQVAAAHAAVEAGAHLVLGHHAQVVQGVEFYNGGVIAYGLGNIAFTDSAANNTVILNVWLDAMGVRQLEIVPVLLLNNGRPSPAAGAQATYIQQLVYDLSDDLR